MKKVLKSMFLLLSAGVFAMVGKAVEPIATWTNFSEGNLTQGGITLNLNGNTVAEDGSSVTIGETAGLTISVDGKNWKELSLIVDASSAETAMDNATLFDVSMNGGNSHVSLHSYKEGESSKLTQRWNNGGNYPANNYPTWTPNKRQTLMFTVKQANPGGTSSFIDGLRLRHDDTLMTTNGTLHTVSIGAYNGTTASQVAKGLVIHSIKLYNTKGMPQNLLYAKYSPVYTMAAANTTFHSATFTRMTDGAKVVGSTDNNWQVFASKITGNTSAKYGTTGATLRLTDAVTNCASNATFTPLSLTGLIIEKGATGNSLTGSGDRKTELGDVLNTGFTSYFTLHEDFTISRSTGDLTCHNASIFEIDEGKTFSIIQPVVVKENASVTLTNGGLLKITGNLKLENGTTLNGHTNASAATTSDAGTIQITDNVLVNSGASIGGSGTINCVLKLADGANLDASQGMLKANEVWMLSGAPNATVTLPANAADGTAILACKNNQVSDLVNVLSTKVAAKDFKCVAVEEDGYKVIKLAVTKVSVTLPIVENAKWLYKGEEVSGSIKVDPNQEVILTLQPGDLYVFAGGGTSQTVTIPVGTTNVTVNAGDLNLPEVVAAKAKIGNVKYASIGTACEAADDGDVIVLLQDLAIAETKVMNFDNKTITLDLNGKTQTATVSPAILVTSGTLNLINNSDEDATITAPGVVIQQGVKNADPVTETTVNIGKDVILISVNETADDGDNVVLLYGKATLTSEGVLSTISQNYAAIQGSGGDKGANTSITINGGSVTSWFNHAIYQPQAGTVTINGGEIEGVTGIEMRAGTLTVNGGKITATAEEYTFNKNGNGSTVMGAAIAVSPHAGVESITATINGGTIGDDETAKALAIVHTIDAMPPEINATITAKAIAADAIDMDKVEVDVSDLEFKANNGSYTLGMKTSGAIIKNEWYETLQDAINAAAPGDRVILLGDVTVAGTDEDRVVINKAITIEGKGKTLTATNTSSNCRAINVDCDGAVTIEDLTIVAKGARAINIINQAATVTINGVTATADNNAAYIAPSAGAAKVAIDGCNFTGLAVVYVCGEKSQVTIANSTIKNVDANADENYGAITVWSTAIGATVDVTNTTITKMDDSKKAYNFIPGLATITGVDEVGCVVAKIGDAGYDTIEEAAGDVKAGQTIVLVTDVTATKALAIAGTIDLNGKTLTADIAGTIKMNGGTFATSQYTMVGADGLYTSTDAVFTIAANETYDMTVTAGTLTLNVAQWWTLEGQTITIGENAAIVIPAGKTLGINGSTIVVNGTATVAGEVQLLTKTSTVKAAANLNVTTSVDGCKVAYVDGVYRVAVVITIPEEIYTSTNIPEEVKQALAEAMAEQGVTEIETYTITTKGADNDEATAEAVAAVLEIFDVNPTVDNGKLTVAYEFGISKVEYIGNGKVKITAGVTGAEYRADVTVAFYAEGIEEPIGTATTTADSTTVSISDIDAATLDGKKISVKAATK